MKSVLVTGGAGYIGSHAAKALAKAGFEPVVLDDLSAGHKWAVNWGPLVEGNIGDTDLVRKTIEKYRIEAVVHFAANAYVGESMHQPSRYFQNNVVNSLALLGAMLDTGVDKIVFSSTCATYGVPDRLPITEDHPQEPVNPYGESKLFVEKALRWYSEAHGLKSVCLRYFNACGADPEGEIGECHDPETHLIPLTLRTALGLNRQLLMYGTDYPTDDGTAVRDYVHVSDLADAHVLAVKYLHDGGKSTSINLGMGRGHSVREVVRSVEQVSRKPVKVVEKPRRVGDPPVLVAHAGRATELLGWSPRFTTLEETVYTAWRWHASRKMLAAVV